MREKDKLASAKILECLSLASVVMATIGAVSNDIWLASTQWLLVAIVLGVWGVFVLVEVGYKIGR